MHWLYLDEDRLVGKPRKRWEDIVQRDALLNLGIQGWWRQAGDKEKQRGLLSETMAQNNL
jgi:hypothetical protein